MPLPRIFGRPGILAFLLVMTVSQARAFSAEPLIGLFTDYPWDDPYVAQLKGVIVTISPHVEILDLIHSATPFSVGEGAYLLDQATGEFPSGTIFVAVIDPQVGAERDPILVETSSGKFYIGRDNGLFSTVIGREGFSRAWKLDKPEFYRQGNTAHEFHGRDIFGPVAAHLADGVDPERMGTPLKAVSLLPEREPSVLGGAISAEVQHIDRFGNVVLDLHSDNEIAAELKEGNLVKIQVGRESFTGPLVKTNGEVGKGRLLLLFGPSGLLEISENDGSAAKILKVEPGTVIFLKP
jgi:S-adenosylmethionine hydrolase